MTEQKTRRRNKPKGRLGEILAVLLKYNAVLGRSPEKTRLVLEELGPTFVKLGQIMSMRSDLLPIEYCKELEKLRTSVRPMPFAQVRRLVESELGRPLEEIFSSFSPEALGSASIAQVHRAVLKSGEPVVVKVRRENIREIMASDIELLKKASGMIKLAIHSGQAIDYGLILDEMWQITQQEMDFLNEAANMEKFRTLHEEVAYVSCPRPYPELTTAGVLVMEEVRGIEISKKEELTEAGYDLEEICAKLCDNYVKQIVDDAFFHADPHPGNIRIQDGRIVWLDFGMMGTLSERDRQLFREAVTAIAEHDVDALKTIVLTLGVYKGEIDHSKLYDDIDALLTKYGRMDIGQMNLGVMMEDFLQTANRNGISLPKGMSMFGRGLMTLEGVVADLCPTINLVEIMANHIAGSRLAGMDWKKELTSLLKNVAVSSKKSLEIPAQLSDFLKMNIRGQSRLNLSLNLDERSRKFLDRITTRVLSVVLLAALLVTSGLLCLIQTGPTLIGLPLPAFIGFCLTALYSLFVLIFRRK